MDTVQELESPSIDDLVQEINDNPNKGFTPCYLCGGEMNMMGETLAYYPTTEGKELVHIKCLKKIERQTFNRK
jgi:hypothetical protein